MFVGGCVVRVRRPDQQKHSAGFQEQGVGAVIDVLAAEIPDVELAATARNGRGRGHHTMGGIGVRFEILIAQAVDDLGLADAAVAEHHQFDVRQGYWIVAHVGEVGADGLKTVRRQDVGRQAANFGA